MNRRDFLKGFAITTAAVGSRQHCPLLIGTTFSEVSSNAMAFLGSGNPIYKNDFTEEEADAYLTEKFGDRKEAVVEAFAAAYPSKKPIDAAFMDTTAYRLEAMMSGAWAAFAKTGDPNHEGMPFWPAWTPEEGAAMIFDEESFIGYHHDDAVFEALCS